MKTTYARWPFLVVVLALAAPATAQEDRRSNILNSLELAQLVARADFSDHTRLSAHFSALGDGYAAEASRHRSMSEQFAGNAGRILATGTSMHCRQLAELNSQAATTARELATYHDALAGGWAATLPRGVARFYGGAGAPEPSKHQVNLLTARARTLAEQGALREYFVMRARRYHSNAKEHVRLAQAYRGTRIAHAAVHHDWLADRARTAAQEAQATAERHSRLVTWTK